MKIVGISGSLRKGSFNTALLKEIEKMKPQGVEFKILSIGKLPLFNHDLEMNLPEVVQEFKNKIKSADAFIIASPEYNYSITGVLKNAIDWASRPKGDNSFGGKVGAILGASDGVIATARSQYELRKIFVALNCTLVAQPEIMVGEAQKKIDESGNVTDDKLKERLKQMLGVLIGLV